jgi:hypothetical protein
MGRVRLPSAALRSTRLSQRTRAAVACGGKSLRRGQQLALPLPHARDGTRRGGARAGAGRKRVGTRGSTPHRARPQHRAGEPVLVTMRAGLGPLRSRFVFPTLKYAIGGANRREPTRFRVVHFSVQHDHLHLIVEAESRRALSAGMRGLSIRVARAVNELLLRRGKFSADRWHGRALGSPREVRNSFARFRHPETTVSRRSGGISQLQSNACGRVGASSCSRSEALDRPASSCLECIPIRGDSGWCRRGAARQRPRNRGRGEQPR